MFRRKMLVLATLLLLSGPLQSQETPRDTLERAIKALGGEPRLFSGYAHLFKGKGIAERGDKKMGAIRCEIWHHPSGKYRLEATLQEGDQVMTATLTFDGKEGWINRSQDQGWHQVTQEEMIRFPKVQYPDLVALLQDKGAKLERLAETEVLKKKAVGIEVRQEGKPDLLLFFEKELLELLRKRTPTEEQTKQARALIRKLSDDTFTVREQAAKELVKLGPAALPALQNASKDDDLDVARRAQECLKTVQEQNNPATLRAAIRLLGLRRSEGTVETLLAFLPGAEPAVAEEIRFALLAFAEAPGGPPAVLVQALEDKEPARREAARAVLGKDGGVWLKKPGRVVFPTGVKMPYKVIFKEEQGETLLLNVEEIQIFNQLEDKLFARPKE